MKKTIFRMGTEYRAWLIVYLVIISFVTGMLAQQLIIKNPFKKEVAEAKKTTVDLTALQEKVLPQNGYKFKIKWGNLGKQMAEDGVIDKVKLAQALENKDELNPEYAKYFDDKGVDQIELNQNNAHFWVDILWGLGLAQKSTILDEGPMQQNGDAANFASTGGYTLGLKQPMELYSKFNYINLSKSQQSLVKEIADGIFRPCCGNSTAFPDCNHGMAALGLIELMVSQGFSKDEIFKTVLAFNSYWFPQTYLDIAYHFAKNDRDYSKVSAAEILSKSFSSSSGYQAIKRQVGQVDWPLLKQGGSCGA